MSVKLSKKEQLQIIEELRYGPDWPKIRQTILEYDYSISSKNPYPQGSKKITYKILGKQQQLFTTSQRKVQKKISQYLPLCSQQPLQSSNHKSLQRSNQPQYFYQKQQRYYNNQIFCKNCTDYGHPPQFCPNQKKCLYCLCPTHYTQKCTHKNICFECYELRHSTQNCQQKQSRIYCNNCQRKHMKYDDKNYCYSLTKNREEKKQLFPTDQFYNCMEILCVRCRKHGHLYCV